MQHEPKLVLRNSVTASHVTCSHMAFYWKPADYCGGIVDMYFDKSS